MSHFLKKRARLRWVKGSRFKVQRWGFLTKCDSKSSEAADSGLPHATRALTARYACSYWMHVGLRMNVPKCPKMSQNVPQCPTQTGRTGHPHRATTTYATTTYRISMFQNVPKCPTMSHNVPLSEKTASAPVGSRFQVQSSRLGISDEMRLNVSVNVTKPDETRRNPTLCEKGGRVRAAVRAAKLRKC